MQRLAFPGPVERLGDLLVVVVDCCSVPVKGNFAHPVRQVWLLEQIIVPGFGLVGALGEVEILLRARGPGPRLAGGIKLRAVNPPVLVPLVSSGCGLAPCAPLVAVAEKEIYDLVLEQLARDYV